MNVFLRWSKQIDYHRYAVAAPKESSWRIDLSDIIVILNVVKTKYFNIFGIILQFVRCLKAFTFTTDLRRYVMSVSAFRWTVECWKNKLNDIYSVPLDLSHFLPFSCDTLVEFIPALSVGAGLIYYFWIFVTLGFSWK